MKSEWKQRVTIGFPYTYFLQHKGTEIRKRKTDIIDSVLIAGLIRYGDFIETSLPNEDLMSLRNLSRFHSYLVSSIGDLKRKVICVLDQVFPEYHTAFSDIFGETSKELLSIFQTASGFENITSEQIGDSTSKKPPALAGRGLSYLAGLFRY